MAHTERKYRFFRGNQQDYIEFTEIIVLSHSFDWKLKIESLDHFYSKKYEMILGSDKESHPLKGPIYRSKQKAK
jgi:hypothetical protein